ncbi:MAG: 2-amino-4-hydroxy-6-hydroxymethyldihydropteridine diphosphokinase [Phycisphaerales bacterium JB059]
MPETSEQPTTAAIALGSNLGDRRATLESALRSLALTPRLEVLLASPFLETDPVGPGTQGAYLNAAAILRTTRDPRDLLRCMQRIEIAHGRDRSTTERWGPRTLDLDLILYADERIEEPGLTVPHPEFRGRLFVLRPLGAIAPDLVDPVTGRTLARLLGDLERAQERPRASDPGA